MKIDSRFISTPIEVFALLVIYGINGTLSACNADLNVWGTDVNDDLLLCVCDGMDSRLREGVSRYEGCSESNRYNLPQVRSKG